MEEFLTKIAVNATTTLTAILLSWLVGKRIALSYALKQKRKEEVLAAVSEFQRIYGHWFSIAKRWIAHVKHHDGEADLLVSEKGRALLDEVLILEGDLESLLMKLSSQYKISAEFADDIERFREGFQELRRTIWAKKSLSWFGNPGKEYVAYKTMAAQIVARLSDEENVNIKAPSEQVACQTFARVTSNRRQVDWFID